MRFSAEDLFPRNPLATFAGLLVSFLCIQMLMQTTFLSFLPRTFLFTFIMMLIITGLVTLSFHLGSRLLERTGYLLPGVWLWFFPFLSMVLTHLLFFLLIKPIPDLAGRDCWSRLLELNAKCTTLAITSAFSGTVFFLGLYVIIGVLRFIERTVSTASELEAQMLQEITRDSGKPGPASQPPVAPASASNTEPPVESETTIPLPPVKERLKQMEEGRRKAKKFNQTAILMLFLLLAVMVAWVILARPETILYYRGMVQLISRQHPEHALEAFRHLAQKFPDYQYLDTVLFQAAWTLDRRLGQIPEAMKAYQEFLNRFGPENVWSDDVTANLIRLAMDKQSNASETLRWATYYQSHFPAGALTPHVLLYEIRALDALAERTQATSRRQDALNRFGEISIPLYDAEDDFVTTLPFRTALESLGDPTSIPADPPR